MLAALCYLGLVSTVYMTGVVWFAQVVHYPLLKRGVDDNDFPAFAAEYQRRTLWVVLPGLTGEVASSTMMVWLWPSSQTWIGLVLLAVVWGLTLSFQIPQHTKLKHGYDRDTHEALVRWNLPRAIVWSLRSIVLVWTTLTIPTG